MSCILNNVIISLLLTAAHVGAGADLDLSQTESVYFPRHVVRVTGTLLVLLCSRRVVVHARCIYKLARGFYLTHSLVLV